MREEERWREGGRGRREEERDALGLNIFKHVFVLFCVDTEAIPARVRRRIRGNTNMMPHKNKGDGPIVVLSDGCWVKSVLCFLSRCNERALLLVLFMDFENLNF